MCLLISWVQSLSALILEHKKIKSVTVSIFSPSICHDVMGLDVMILVFGMLSFKPLLPTSPLILGAAQDCTFHSALQSTTWTGSHNASPDLSEFQIHVSRCFPNIFTPLCPQTQRVQNYVISPSIYFTQLPKSIITFPLSSQLWLHESSSTFT